MDQISIKNLTDFGRIFLENLLDIPKLAISMISVDSGQRVNNLKIAENSHFSTEYNIRISRILTRYRPDIKAFCTPDIMSCHLLTNPNRYF